MADRAAGSDHKTIAEFRRQNGPAIRKTCAKFGLISAAGIGVLKGEIVAVDGSKFKAVKQSGPEFHQRARSPVVLRIWKPRSGRYIEVGRPGLTVREPVLARAERAAQSDRVDTTRIRKEIERLLAMEENCPMRPDGQISLTDPDARAMGDTCAA